MKKVITVLFFVLILLRCNSNAQWTQVYSGTVGNYGVFFVSENIGWTVGKPGEIFKTTDGGYSWTNQSINSSIELNNLYFSDANTGLVFGEKCSIYRTTNGGNNWILKYSDTTSNNLYFISNCFINSTTGYVVGNKIMKTTDAGNSWTIQLVSMNNDFRAVSFVNEQYGWTGYGGTIYRTTNSGINWVQQNVIDSISIRDMKFFNASTGILCANQGKLYKTTNGGSNWALQSILNGSFSSCFFINEYTGWAVGSTSSVYRIYKTTNGGVNWNYQSYSISMWDVFFLNANYGWVTGSSGVFRTTSGGNVFVKNISNEISNKYSLLQNYPNPFNPTTNIRYEIPKNSFVKLIVCDALGREIECLVNEKQSAGTYEAIFNASKYPSGIYFYRLTTENFSETKKMLLIK